jgi:hypothetical protein
MARAAWLLFLRPGVVLEAGWVDEASRFIDEADRRKDASTSAVFGAGGFRPTLADALALLRAALGARPTASQGLLISKSLYDVLGGHRDVGEPEGDLLYRLGRRRVVLLRSASIT